MIDNDDYPKSADIGNKESVVKYLEEVKQYYDNKSLSVSRLANLLKDSELGQGLPAIHKEFGTCFINKIWPKIKENKLVCSVTVNLELPDENNNKRATTRNITVDFKDLIPYNDTGRVLYDNSK